jgi:uncharacterized membrane protein
MKKLIQILRTTVVGGALFLVPFVILIIIMGKALHISRAIMMPLAEKLPIKSFMGFELPWLLGVVVLLLACFLAGLFAKTLTAKNLVNWLETNLLSNLPGYSFIKNLGEEFAGGASTHSYQSVLVQFDDAWQLGFLVERIDGGKVVVFIPDSPNPWSGGVFIFDEGQVTLLEEASTAAFQSLKKLGAGTGDLIRDELRNMETTDNTEN